VLLAVFLSGWTWLYTFKANAKKFWIFLGAIVVDIILFGVAFSSTHQTISCSFNGCVSQRVPNHPAYLQLAGLIAFGMWVWAIIDNSVKSQQWYANYPG
jgi:hypothetical protein